MKKIAVHLDAGHDRNGNLRRILVVLETTPGQYRDMKKFYPSRSRRSR